MWNGTGHESTGQNTLSAEDAELLRSAHRELLTAQAQGVSVLGSTNNGEVLAVAYAQLETADELQVRRERRAAARMQSIRDAA